jgi:TRAP-type C4-dicarboxylate transport system permease small subunit
LAKKYGEKIQQFLLYISWSLAGTFLVIMTFSVFLQVFTRYIFHFSYSWPEELARFSFIWTSLTGACIALELKKLHDIDIVFNLFPKALKPFISIFSHILICAILTVLVIYGLQLTVLVHPQLSPAMEIRMSYVYFAVPFAAGLMLISYICEIIYQISDLMFSNTKRETV